MMLVNLPSLQKTQPAPTIKVKANRRPPLIAFQNKINPLSLRAKYKLLRLRQVRDPLRSRKMKIKLLAATTILFQQRCNMSASKVSRLKKK